MGNLIFNLGFDILFLIFSISDYKEKKSKASIFFIVAWIVFIIITACKILSTIF